MLCNIPRVRKIIIDNCALDPFVDTPGAHEAALAAIERGDLEIWYVHTTLDEAAATGDLDRRVQLLIVLVHLGRLIPSDGFIFNQSRFDVAAFGSDDDSLAKFGSDNLSKHGRDALAAATARGSGWALVTHDRRLTNQAKESGVEVLTTQDLLAELGFTPSTP